MSEPFSDRSGKSYSHRTLDGLGEILTRPAPAAINDEDVYDIAETHGAGDTEPRGAGPAFSAAAPRPAAGQNGSAHYLKRLLAKPAEAAQAPEVVRVPAIVKAPQVVKKPAVAAERMPDPGDRRVVRVVCTIIAEALKLGASRILILPGAERVKLAYRIQGVVCPCPDLPRQFHYPVLASLMSMANLYGAIKLVAGRREEKLRVAFKAVRHGLSALLEVTPDATIAESARAETARLGHRYVALDGSQPPSAAALATVDAEVAREERLVPLTMEGPALFVAMAHPPAPQTMRRLGLRLKRPLVVVLAPEGALRAAIERHYGPSDPELADAALWKVNDNAQRAMLDGSSAPVRLPKLTDGPWHQAAKPLVDHLPRSSASGCSSSSRGSPWAESSASRTPLPVRCGASCPMRDLVAGMPQAARRYIEAKVSVLRTAIAARLEQFLEKDALAKALAMTYGQYLACCTLAQGRAVSIDPAANREACINFVYGLAVRSFAEVESNGALLSFLAERAGELSRRVAELLENRTFVRDPGAARSWLARLARQTTADDPLDLDSPPIVHLLELLVADAVQVRASGMALVPHEDCVEVALRIQTAVYRREGIALQRLYPLLARLRMLADAAGRLPLQVGGKERQLRVTLQATEQGLAAVIDILPDASAAETCRAQAVKAGYAVAEFEDLKIPEALLRLVPKAVARKKAVLPLAARDGTLTVVVAAPPTACRLEDLRLTFNNPLAVAMAPEDEIQAAIYRHYHPASSGPAPSPTALALLGRK